MILKKYEERGLLLNVAFVDAANDADIYGFRGRLALVEGELGDKSGNRKPPSIVMEQAVLLSNGEKLSMISGSLDRLEDLPTLVEMYKESLVPETLAIIYVVNITKPMQVEFDGVNFTLVPMREGIAWNELMDEGGLDKSDLKKMSSGQKVYTVWEALKGYTPKGEKVSFEEALKNTADIKRVERGAL